MTDRVVRWVPASGIMERPAELVDFNWQAGQLRLIATVHYARNRDEIEDLGTAVLIFEEVFALRLFDENMDYSDVLSSAPAQLPSGYPYGGRWPFLEVHSSSWIGRLTKQDGVWSEDAFRHLVVTTRNMHLHVACQRGTEPIYHA